MQDFFILVFLHYSTATFTWIKYLNTSTTAIQVVMLLVKTEPVNLPALQLKQKGIW